MDLNLLMPWLGALALFISLGTSIHAFFTSGAKQIGAQLKTAEKTLIEHDRRIQTIESDLKHLPDAQDVTEMKLAMSELRGAMNVQAEVMGSVARTVQRLEGYLLEKNK